jgi:hypothetical protein
MSLIKHRIANLLVIGLGLLAVCPIASAQSVFDDSETDATPPKAEWRQKVLHNNKGPQQIARASTEDTESRTVQWSPYPNSNQETEYRTAQRAPYAKSNQETEYRMAQRSPYQNSNRVRPSGVTSTAYNQPKNYRVAQREIPAAMEEDPSATQYEPLAAEGAFSPQGGCESGCGDCGDSGDCIQCCPWMFSWGPRVFSIFGGVNGNKGPRDRGLNGNFGFQEGLNFGAPLGDPWGCGYQVGFAALQDNISGYQTSENIRTPTAVTADRHQYFFTAGIFNRAECSGWQWGVVFDMLNDSYVQNATLKQIRTETGYLFNESFEIGYSGAYGVGGDSVNGTYFGRTVDGQLDATDQFVAYFRRYFENGGDGRIWGGMTGHGDGLFGADAWIPLGGSWAMQNSFNYLIPKGGRGSSVDGGVLEGAQVRESWSVAINLVWYPGRSSKCIGKSCYRPLLNVADNSLFMVRETANVHN